MSRRANGEGSIRHRKDGRWECRVTDSDGHRISLFASRKSEVAAKLREARKRLDASAPVRDATRTVGEWIAEWKQDGLDGRSTRRGPMKESTKESYRTLARLHLEEGAIGRVRLDRLRAADVERLIASLRNRVNDEGEPNPLAESSIRSVYHVLRLALDAAVTNRLIARNPARDVPRPVAAQEEARHLSPADVRRLLEAAKAYRYHEALELIAGTGMRRGEALALKWGDVDLLAGTAAVHGTLARIGGELSVTDVKTRRSRRTVALTPALVDSLALLKDRQEAERKTAANTWHETGFVFTTEFGQAVDPRNVYRALQWAADKAKITDVGVHTLRHSWASASANAGEPIANVSELLGHADVRITQRYVHTDSEGRRQTALRTAELFGL